MTVAWSRCVCINNNSSPGTFVAKPTRLPNPHGWRRCSDSVTNLEYCFVIHLVYCFSILKVNETHMEFLSASEFLGEISDDLLDDVLHNTFNMLRMFIGIYGTSSGPTLFVSSYR
ncbi:hypothetical protein Hanom_Chr15g01388651 [Helianthus anomalus]